MSSSPPPPATDFATWDEACLALYRAFVSTTGAPSGFTLHFHDAAGCHFQDDGPGPDYTLVGVDWQNGRLRWGSIYMPKQDGGYHGDAPLPEDWLAALRRLRRRTWNEGAPRFGTPLETAGSLFDVADPPRRAWVESPWRLLPGPPPGGGVDVFVAPCGHPLDVVVVCLDRAAGTVTGALIDAEGPISALGRAPLPTGLLADLAALPATAWPPGFSAEAIPGGSAAAALRAAAREALAAAPPAEPSPGPIADFVAQFGPTRWFLPGVEIAWCGPSWRFEADVPHTTLYGRFRLTGAWVGVVFGPEFERCEFVENIMGPRPARTLGAFAVPADWRPSLDAAYRAKR